MAKAKVTPVVKKEQQIVLTKEQYAKLYAIKDILDSVDDLVNEIVNDVDKENTIQIGFTLGKVSNENKKAYGDLNELLWDIKNDEDVQEEYESDLDF